MMGSLPINTIPIQILGRIMMQLPTFPTHITFDLMPLLSAGLHQLGNTHDLHAFLNYCQSLLVKDESDMTSPWLWQQYVITDDADWDISNHKKPHELVGIRFFLASEIARKSIELTRFTKRTMYDPKSMHFFQGHAFPVDHLLNDTLQYLKKERGDDPLSTLVEKMIELRLEKFTRDKYAFIQHSNDLDHTDYHLLGVLMVRSKQDDQNVNANWCLYLRDYYMEGGSLWRVFLNDSEVQIHSEQAMADIRDSEYQQKIPSSFSKAFRPLYLFYGNFDAITPTESSNGSGQSNNYNEKREGPVITLDDYTFDEEYEYDYDQQQQQFMPEEENEPCMRCGIKDIEEDVNDIFFCESCNRGVHQLCEDPPIQAFEKDIDPWFCRDCLKQKNLPIPTLPQPSSNTIRIQWETQEDNNTSGDNLLTKRKREDNDKHLTITEELDNNKDEDGKKVLKRST
ncbi:MAG: hypothetical protein EXX96DRAFT_511385 [Benjaminiella poitrasii]|nr:MAG: hypothetical protein EXX96DRAFT_511385 [Benjaminiella poitrasii]